ncbi:Neurogenic locus notch protein [Schistosoma japonicum]|uniref:BLOC-1-related complex subunit 6 C-terminal helix domain-containing protein n=1 Tax=Schistosoma japonicum TaxID=6182 RepID=C1LF73_SCHJA|nr:Neurogenic locus notch protein [Schistosoma japonicum]CAX73351.1 hypothetical protein [Schistosoma japonicum]
MCALQLGILPELEKSADGIAQHLELLLHSLKSTLNQMSSLTLDCTTVFSDSVDYTCETVNSCIKSTYVLMAKCEELSKSMSQLEPLKKEIEGLKRTLSKFEESLSTPLK